MSKIAKILGGAAILATVGMAGQAHAIGVTYTDAWQGASNQAGSIGISMGSTLANTTSVDITNAEATINSTSGNNAFFQNDGGSAITFSPTVLAQNSSTVTLPFTASWVAVSGFGGQTFGGTDTFTFTASQSAVNQFSNLGGGTQNDILSFFGTVADSQSIFATQTAFLNIALSQSQNSPISAAITFSTPFNIPEPISMTVLGMGLLGLAAVRRRA